MRIGKLAVATVFGAMLALPVMAQTPAAPTTTVTTPPPAKPAVTPPVTTTTPKTPTTATTATTKPPAATPATTATPVNLNTATPDQLDALPGVGPSRLKKIIAARPFTSVDQLDSKKLVPHSVYLKIKDKVAI